jgi:uncharacterized membrane protein YdbT with pleckstrin-like domain
VPTGSYSMKYVQKVLQPGELLVYATTLHWFIYLRAITFAIIGIILLVACSFLPEEDARTICLMIVSVVFALVTFSIWLRAFIRRATTELDITNRRVIYKAGLLRRNTFEMHLSKVESVGVQQGLLGRILGYGEVEIKGTGSSLAPVATISNPLAFRSHITAAC